MKKLIIAIALVGFFAIGCSWIGDRKADFNACIADPACNANANKWKDRIYALSVPLAAAVPVPGAAAAPTVFGYIAFGLAALIGGHALTKKAPAPVVAPITAT